MIKSVSFWNGSKHLYLYEIQGRTKNLVSPNMSRISEKILELKSVATLRRFELSSTKSCYAKLNTHHRKLRILISPLFHISDIILIRVVCFLPIAISFSAFFKCYCKNKLSFFFFPVYKTPDGFFWDTSSCKLSDSSNTGPSKKLRECPSTKNTNIEYRWQWLAITCGIAACLGIRLVWNVLTGLLELSAIQYCLFCQRSPGPKATSLQLHLSESLPKVELIHKRSLFWVNAVLSRSKQIQLGQDSEFIFPRDMFIYLICDIKYYLDASAWTGGTIMEDVWFPFLRTVIYSTQKKSGYAISEDNMVDWSDLVLTNANQTLQADEGSSQLLLFMKVANI